MTFSPDESRLCILVGQPPMTSRPERASAAGWRSTGVGPDEGASTAPILAARSRAAGVTSPGRWTTVELALVFAAAFAVTGSISLGLWGALGVFLARLLRTPAQWRGLNVALALLLVTSIVPIWLEA